MLILRQLPHPFLTVVVDKDTVNAVLFFDKHFGEWRTYLVPEV